MISTEVVSGVCMGLFLLSMDLVDSVVDICPNFLSVALQAACVHRCLSAVL